MAAVLLRIAIVLVCGVLSAFGAKDTYMVALVTAMMAVAVAAEDVNSDGDDPEESDSDGEGRKTKREKYLLICAVAVCAALMGYASGRWWGCVAWAAVSVSPVLGVAAAAVEYAVLTILGFASPKLTGFAAEPETSGAGRVAEIILTLLVLLLTVAVLMLVIYFIRRAKGKKTEEQARLRSSMLSEMNERKLNRELAKQNYSTERNARLVERENISRNIHNNVGHSITAAIMTLDAADMLFEAKPEEARKRMKDANERIRGSLDSIRSAVRALDDEGGEVPISDLKHYIENTVEGFTMDTERKVNCVYELYSEDILVAKEHAEYLTGVLQECLSNGARHGNADRFTVLMTADTAHIKLTVSDNGHSDFGDGNRAERIAGGFGLKKIEAYAKRCGGAASFTNDEGFRTVVELPLVRSGEGTE